MGGSVSTQIKLCTGRPFQRKKLKHHPTKNGGAGSAGSNGSGNGGNGGDSGGSRHQHNKRGSLHSLDVDVDVDGDSGGLAYRRESGSVSAASLSVAVKPPKLRASQKALLRETWVLVEEHISEIGLTAFLSLFQRSPEALSLFPFLKHLDKEDLEFYSQLQHHAVRVTGVVTLLIKELNKQDEAESEARVREFLTDLGRRHFSYGSRPNQMELLGHAFIDTFMHIFEGDPRRGDIQDAWKSFFSIMCFWMAHGYMFVRNKGKAPVE